MTGSRLKRIFFWLFGIGVASAASFYMLGLNGKPVDPNSVTIDPITFNGETITFTYTDDNTGENLIIKTDRQTYNSWGDTPIYFAIKNISLTDQNVFPTLVSSKDERFAQVYEYKPQQPREVSKPILSDKQECKKDALGYDHCSYPEIGSTTETQYVDEWYKITKQKTILEFKALDQKPALKDYKTKDQFQFWIPSGQTKYFKAFLTFSPKSKGEFYIKAFGSKDAYGSLDPWYNSSWPYRMQVTVNYTKVGTSSPITGIPLLISTTTPTLAYTGSGGKVGKSDGTDIVVTASDGTTKLSHEIESYSSTTGETIIWFKTDTSTPLSSTTNTSYYIYYGNSGASDQQDSTNVWDSNYKGVWHLDELGTATNTDSTSLGQNGIKDHNASSTTGQIGRGLGCDGNDDRVSMGDTTAMDGATTTTFSVWFKPDMSFTTNTSIVRKDGGFTPLQYIVDSNAFYTNLWIPSLNLTHSGYVATGSWMYWTAIWDSANDKVDFYVNGVFKRTHTGVVESSGLANTTNPLVLCVTESWGEDYRGLLDELRLSNKNRSTAWMLTEYNNQSSPGTFMTWGTEESAPAAGGTTTRRRIIID